MVGVTGVGEAASGSSASNQVVIVCTAMIHLVDVEALARTALRAANIDVEGGETTSAQVCSSIAAIDVF